MSHFYVNDPFTCVKNHACDNFPCSFLILKFYITDIKIYYSTDLLNLLLVIQTLITIL